MECLTNLETHLIWHIDKGRLSAYHFRDPKLTQMSEIVKIVWIVVCPSVLFLLAIVLFVLLLYTDSDCPFGIFKLFLNNGYSLLVLTIVGGIRPVSGAYGRWVKHTAGEWSIRPVGGAYGR